MGIPHSPKLQDWSLVIKYSLVLYSGHLLVGRYYLLVHMNLLEFEYRDIFSYAYSWTMLARMNLRVIPLLCIYNCIYTFVSVYLPVYLWSLCKMHFELYMCKHVNILSICFRLHILQPDNICQCLLIMADIEEKIAPYWGVWK